MSDSGGVFSVCYTPVWVEGMVAGRGWIALALVVFATWRPARVLLGAYLYGGEAITENEPWSVRRSTFRRSFCPRSRIARRLSCWC